MAGDKMNSWRRTLWACLVLLACTACGGDKKESTSAELGGPVRWAQFPVAIHVDNRLQDGGPAEEDLLTAIAFWEQRAGKTLFTISSWPASALPYTGSVTDPDTLLDNVIYLLKPWPNSGDWNSQIAGKTVIHSEGAGISHAVVFLNGETTLCDADCKNEGENQETSRRRLIAHELGHFLGFVHVSDRENIMYPTIQPGGDLDTETIDVDLLRRLTR